MLTNDADVEVQVGDESNGDMQGEETSDARLRENPGGGAEEVDASKSEVPPPPVPDWDEAEVLRAKKAPIMPSAKDVEEH